jgi:hypothetical protein
MEDKELDYSKKIIRDIRALLWIVTIAGIVLAFCCVYRGFLGTLGWITTLVGLPWSAYSTVCSFYLNMAKSDHREGGITYDMAMKQFDDETDRGI